MTAAVGTPEPLIRVQNLKKHFPITAGVFRRQVGTVKAVDGISFDLLPKETLGLVGESGCGKTTAGRTVLNLYTPTEGKVYFGQTEVTALGVNDLRTMRQKMQMIFQDPQDSLNPRMTVGSIISEPLLEHTKVSGLQRTERVEELLQAVGLNAKYMNRYPHEFSGGQRQRIGVARALALNPEFIICDEPIAA
ncbi:MAG TPA: ABC transporter ATP-binding protein, partial [Gammaproteobacteria bacterium]|nr:ABC transporter ATP-binding protein [Gammaproteobacteria bacterium]